MKLEDSQERTLDRWLSAVETGNPDGDYGNVTVLNDNPKGEAQLTYGKHQTTEAGGNLKKLVRSYLKRNSDGLTPMGRERMEEYLKSQRYSMTGNRQLKTYLRRAGDDPEMQDVQNEFFLEHYMKPARSWADSHGFKEALSMLVIYDSFIQSGGIPSWIRKRFGAVPPSKGGEERRWTSSYVDARHQWLKHWGDGRSSKSRAIRSSSYRTKALNFETDRDNWDLSDRPIKVNGIFVERK